MRVSKLVLAVGALAAVCVIPAMAAEDQPSSLDQMADRIRQRETQEMAALKKYTPLVEVYIQDLGRDRQLGEVPDGDAYFLGKADLRKGAQFRSLLNKPGLLRRMTGDFKAIFVNSYSPNGFAQMIYPDARGLDRAHYDFQYVRREFLGEVRCLVFDVTPKKHAGGGRFKGRIWVDDQGFAIVRFKGVFAPGTMFGWYFHFDSWRVNAGPDLWLPAYVYSEESQTGGLFSHIRFKGQIRLWGYNQSAAAREEELGKILVESSAPVQDQSDARRDYSPVESRRAFEREAEENVIERMERSGLLAPRGSVNTVLETVVNNLEVSNSLDIQPEVHCGVLLTSTLESFTVGRTIILSRGLIDVLPDEASLASILAQELANITLGRTIETKYAFNDRLLFADKDTFHVLNFREDRKDQEAAGRKAVELMKNSPYKDSLASAGLFLKVLQARSKELPHLISPRLGNRVYEAQAFINSSPKLEMARTDQIAALPLGSRVKLDPWSDQLEMMKAAPVRLLSAKEKMPFEVTPVHPYLTRKSAEAATPAAAPATQAPAARTAGGGQP